VVTLQNRFVAGFRTIHKMLGIWDHLWVAMKRHRAGGGHGVSETGLKNLETMHKLFLLSTYVELIPGVMLCTFETPYVISIFQAFQPKCWQLYPSQPLLFDHTTNIFWKIQITKHLVL
jgi:hypothetical protein